MKYLIIQKVTWEKKGLPLHDINDVMHSQKHKTQISHEHVHVHKPKHFHWQPIHNNELEHLITTCPLSTSKDTTNKILVNNSILELQFTQVCHHLHHITQKKIVAKTTNFSLDNI
jgi:hypothetical protein